MSDARLRKLTVVFEYYESKETYSRILLDEESPVFEDHYQELCNEANAKVYEVL